MLAENRLALIRTWSMAGAREDLGMHFDSPIDLNAIGAGSSDAVVELDSSAPAHVLMKPAGEDEWQPLVAERDAA